MIQDKISFSVTLNGIKTTDFTLPGHWRLIDFLHEYEGLTGTKFGCGTGVCKACTVAMIDENGMHHAIPACSTSLDVCNGWNIITVEGLQVDSTLHPLQLKFIEDESFQCGYCTPGFLMESFVLLENGKKDGGFKRTVDDVVDDALECHLCRCTGYQRYANSVKSILNSNFPHVIPSVDLNQVKWELIQLLHEAAEIENALMLQYLSAAFSIKIPEYKLLAGFGHRTPGQPHDILAVAIEEMMHLDTVNRLLVELGGAPNLIRQDFPYEPDLYPFSFELEVLSTKSLAKYIYTESSKEQIEADPQLKLSLEKILPNGTKINRVGSLYAKIRESLELFWGKSNFDLWKKWDDKLANIESEGEVDHFEFFVSVFKGTHFSLSSIQDVWLDESKDYYPVHSSLIKGTAYKNRVNTFEDENARLLAELSNLHYWLTMGVFEFSYRNNCQFHMIARRHMAGPLLQLCWHLPQKYGVLPPFDQCRMEYYAGNSNSSQLEWLLYLLTRINEIENAQAGLLPEAYLQSSRETQVEVELMCNSVHKNN